MAESDAKFLREVPFEITNRAQIPAKRYYDEEFYQMEVDHLWPHVWQMACRIEQIPNVGDWIEYQNLGKSVIIVRTRHGIKAYRNACRHRGVPLAGGRRQGARQLQGHRLHLPVPRLALESRRQEYLRLRPPLVRRRPA